MSNVKKIIIVGLLGASVAVSACSTEQGVDNSVGATGFVAKTAVQGIIGAGKLAVKGARKVAGSE